MRSVTLNLGLLAGVCSYKANTFFSSCFNTSLPPLNVPDMHNNAVPSEMTPDLTKSLLCTEEVQGSTPIQDSIDQVDQMASQNAC